MMRKTSFHTFHAFPLFVAFVAGVLLTASGATADVVTTKKGIPYTGRLTGYEDFSVRMTLANRQKVTKPLQDIRQIELSNNRAFTQAEKDLGQKKYADAIKQYAKAERGTRDRWLKALIRDRRYQCLVQEGQIAKASESWLSMVDEAADAKAALKLVPPAPKKIEAAEARRAVAVLSKKADELEKAPKKNLAYLNAVLGLMRSIQQVRGDEAGATKTAERIAKANAGSASPASTANASTTRTTAGRTPAAVGKVGVYSAMVDTGKYDAAVEGIEKNFQNIPSSQQGQAYVLLGRAKLGKYRGEGKKDKSLLTQAGMCFVWVYADAAGEPEAAEALYWASQVCRDLDDARGAETALRALVSTYGDDEKNPWVAKARAELQPN